MRPAWPPRTPPRGTRVVGLLLIGLLIGACAIPRWPVEGPVISPFGLRFRGWDPDYHEGVDVYAPEGTPVRAMKPGVVTRAGRFRGLGLAVYLDHGRGLTTIYGHLSSLSVSQGEAVEHRQVIGAVGQTGNATSPHLHFEVLRNGRAVDPVPLLGGRP
jgi:murein DD-endopeptidase MepM/ murein hydrolase activator NlpD